MHCPTIEASSTWLIFVAGYVKTYIILPSTAWGIAKNRLTETGIANPNSIQLPMLIKASLARGQAGVVGKGLALWPHVNIEEREYSGISWVQVLFNNSTMLTEADLYITLYDAIVADSDKVGHGTDGYYFGENGEYSWYDIAKAIGKAMVKLGLSKTDEPTTFTDEELVNFFGSVVGVILSVISHTCGLRDVIRRRLAISLELTLAAGPTTLGRLAGSRNSPRWTCSPASTQKWSRLSGSKRSEIWPEPSHWETEHQYSVC